MKVAKETSSPTEVILTVNMDSEDEEPFINRSYRRVAPRLRIPGFRPGKAPRSIVQNHVGRSALIQEALDFMVPETLDQVLKEEDLQAFAQPSVELLEMEPVSFKAVVPLEPVVDLGDFRSISLEREPVSVEEEQVDKVVEQLRYQATPWEPVIRPILFGDLVSLDVKGVIDGDEVIDDRGADFIPDKDNGRPFPGFSSYVEGMTEGQEREFTLPVPDDYPQTTLAGKECRFIIKVLSVKAKILPPLDDEFAKSVGEGYESLGALQSFVQEKLAKEAEDSSLRKLEEQSLAEVVKTAHVQVSEVVYQRELDQMQDEQAQGLKSRRVDMDTYLKAIGKTEEELREELRPQAEERLTRYLVLRRLAKEEGIEVSADDIEAEIQKLISASGDSASKMRQTLSSENARDSVRSSILTRKVMHRLVEIVESRGDSTLSSGAGSDAPPTSENEAVVEIAETKGAESHAS